MELTCLLMKVKGNSLLGYGLYPKVAEYFQFECLCTMRNWHMHVHFKAYWGIFERDPDMNIDFNACYVTLGICMFTSMQIILYLTNYYMHQSLFVVTKVL